MPFKQINVNEQIIEKRKTDSEFDTLWQESRNEYKLLAELVKIRKESMRMIFLQMFKLLVLQ